MKNSTPLISRAAFLAAGLAAGAIAQGLAVSRLARDLAALKRAFAEAENRLDQRRAGWEERFRCIEARLDDHEARLNQIPSTAQIVAAMEELLSAKMASFDQRLEAQSASIERLKNTVAQTDILLERVLGCLNGEMAYDATGTPKS